ncbi:DUF397 domain-containing protein [Streptomyces sp. LP05-1]|uniref:DUF397 domain-containing protein n=1 Tax=Streptomyces pyxinae TaxID=2970734 RepID=A0ABT2CQG0_9ACTN|nr:DUF397 domain-containing protein [Streptomyces sp. LP05-1]MCS0639501.1 DUF397 domain-containing protein [Streptomyces sp. LP05-1]
MSTTDLTWFKSSYSGSSGDSCVEVALAWHKSSHSGSSGDDCVEIATCPTTVHIRDSKDKQGPQLALTPSVWTTFLTHTR